LFDFLEIHEGHITGDASDQTLRCSSKPETVDRNVSSADNLIP